MNTWQEDLLNLLLIPAASPEGIFIHFETAHAVWALITWPTVSKPLIQ